MPCSCRADLMCRTSLTLPKRSEVEEPSATESTLRDALENSKISLKKLLALKSAVDSAVEKEQTQIQRLALALEKVQWCWVLSQREKGLEEGLKGEKGERAKPSVPPAPRRFPKMRHTIEC
jgi:hypothetical protein